MMKRTSILLSALLVLAAAAAAQPVTETCSDGRVMAVSPFNPRPCETHDRSKLAETTEGQLEAAALTAPSEFVAVFGPPPVATGWSMADRVARVQYEQELRYFGGLVPEPVGFDNVSGFYESWGMGKPVFYKGRYGEYCRWPDAPYRPARANMFAAVNGAGVVVASWQVRVVLEGHVLTDLHPFVPPRIRALNDQRLAELRAQSEAENR